MSTSANEEALQEVDSVEEALNALATKVDEAEQAIRDVLAKDPNRTWTIRQLEDEARSVSMSPSVMSIAFLRLHNRGLVTVDDALIVRAVPAGLAA